MSETVIAVQWYTASGVTKAPHCDTLQHKEPINPSISTFEHLKSSATKPKTGQTS